MNNKTNYSVFGFNSAKGPTKQNESQTQLNTIHISDFDSSVSNTEFLNRI
jgi:hypothetical protein